MQGKYFLDLTMSEDIDFEGGPQFVAVSEYTVVNYLYYKQIIENIGFMFLGMCLLFLISSKGPIEFLFLFSFFYCLFGFFFALYYLVRCSNLAFTIRKTFIMDLILDSGYCIVFMAYFLVFNKNLDVSLLPFFIIPHCVLVSVRMCSSFDRQTHVDNQVWAFFEAFQILWISLKVANSSGQPDWGWVLLLTYIVVVLLLIAGIICALALGCFVGIVLNTDDNAREQKNILKYLCHTMFHLSWKSFVFFYLLRNFHLIANENKFGPGAPLDPKGPSLAVISGVMILCAFIDILILCAVSDTLKRLLSQRMFISNQKEDIQVRNLANPMNMHIMQVGANYFQRNQPSGDGENQEDVENQGKKKMPEILDCMICCDKPSNTLVRPCNHGGICETCMVKYMETKDSCPHCKAKIRKVYIMEYNEEKENFFAKRIIKC